MGYRLGSMFFLAMLVAVRIMPRYAAEATIKATAAWQAQGQFFQALEALSQDMAAALLARVQQASRSEQGPHESQP